jgi:hypothetical protein
VLTHGSRERHVAAAKAARHGKETP